MDSPVSAFAVYSANKKPKRVRKNRKKIGSKPSPKFDQIPEHIQIQAANKLKNKQKKIKEPKNLGKKKTHKKKREKAASGAKIQFHNRRISPVDQDIDEVPVLVPVATKHHSDSDNEGSIDFNPIVTNSVDEALKVFGWMIAPYNVEEFFRGVWEKKPLHISRNKSNYYKELISTPTIDHMIRNENIQFTKNIDVTSYINGKRETHNPVGRALPHVVWDYYLNGCSIRLLNPQTYIPRLHILNATMQEYFNSFVGANAYLTPPDSQGFAPHYDDIEAFILQAEGKKHWKIYKPLSENEVLPRESSKNFDQEEIGEPIMEVTLVAGDMLYFPRGYIHQGVTIDGEHSLHVTISMYQKHSWADLLEMLLSAALRTAINENVELREGLPFDIYDHHGIVHSDSKTPRRKEISNIISKMFDTVKKHLPIDDAVDQLHKIFLHSALPPVLSEEEKMVTVYGDSDVMAENGYVINRVEFELDTKIRLLRKNILRMATEEKVRVYYYAENSLEYHGSELACLEIEEEFAPGIENLITAYPEYISVENLQLVTAADKIQLADALWSRGLIMTELPLDNIDD